MRTIINHPLNDDTMHYNDLGTELLRLMAQNARSASELVQEKEREVIKEMEAFIDEFPQYFI